MAGSEAFRRRGLARALRKLEHGGLLLGHDRRHTCVTALVVGEPIPGSWWSHPQTHDIYWVFQQLEHRDDVLRCKLLDGKITFVSRALWPALAAIGRSRERWQTRGLSPGARALLRRIEREGGVRTDQLPRTRHKPGAAARELETRLLVHSDEFHTETGAHAKRLQDWDVFRRQAGLRTSGLGARTARRQLVACAQRLYPEIGRSPRLPWPVSQGSAG